MSWDKQTIHQSEVDAITKVLDILSVPYSVKIIGEALDRGGYMFDDEKPISLRRLEFVNRVVLERVIRTADCDADDTIVSEMFYVNQEPQKWELEITYDEEGNLVK